MCIHSTSFTLSLYSFPPSNTSKETMAPLPTLRWGIIGTGWISTELVKDLLIPRTDAKATHTIQAIGCSSLQKGQSFAKSLLPNLNPKIYGSYSECYNDPNVVLI